jgi:hypothetical protein
MPQVSRKDFIVIVAFSICGPRLFRDLLVHAPQDAKKVPTVTWGECWEYPASVLTKKRTCAILAVLGLAPWSNSISPDLNVR